MQSMFLRAGLLSLALLLASRLLGLLRESVQAAALGATDLGDVAILMLTLPDLLTGLLAAGALSYVLLPLWARQSVQEQAHTQSRLVRMLMVLGVAVGALIALAPQVVTQLLAPGLSDGARATAATALRWSAIATPLALLAALWTTRLQHLRDFTGMYGANLVVNVSVVAALMLVAWGVVRGGDSPMPLLGAGLVVGMVLRLCWLRWRQNRAHLDDPAHPHPTEPTAAGAWPRTSVWVWALASAGLPLALPLLARSLASSAGEGALTTFNYAWKLIELPLVLAIQLVATLAFPGIARAFSSHGSSSSETHRQAQQLALRSAFVLAWSLACAAAAALSGMAPALASLLFGWGRMTPEAVSQVGAWGRIGAWTLLPQALLAVLLTLMASTGRLRGAVFAYLGALALMAVLGWVATVRSSVDGALVMWGLNAALALAAVALLLREREFLRGTLQMADLLPAAAAALALALVAGLLPLPGRLAGLFVALALAATVLGISYLLTPSLRQALRR